MKITLERNFAEISTSQGAPLASPTPVQIAASINNTGGKFATGVNHTGSKFATVSQRRWQIATSINDTGGKQWEQYQTADNLK